MFKHFKHEEIRALRPFCGLSTRSLGDLAGISHQTLYNVEMGYAEVTERTNVRLLRVFMEQNNRDFHLKTFKLLFN